jgi:hypothetical protein
MKPKYKIVCDRNALYETKLYVKKFGIWCLVDKSHFYDCGDALIKHYERMVTYR